LKPGNVMLGKYGETLVVDWGLAKPLATSTQPSADLAATHDLEVGTETPLRPSGSNDDFTKQGAVVGTVAYAPPEQVLGNIELIDKRSDVYGLGAVLYELLAGLPPVQADSIEEAIRIVSSGQIPSPRKAAPLVPKQLEAICLKALSFRPDDRYATASELHSEVERWLDDEPVDALPDPLAMRVRRLLRRHPTLAGVAAVSTVLLAIGLVIFSSIARRNAIILQNKNKELTAANERKFEARQLAETNQESARLQSQLAFDAVSNFSQTVINDGIMREPQFSGLRRELLSQPMRFYESLRQELSGENSIDSRLRLANANMDLARLQSSFGKVRDAQETSFLALKAWRELISEFPEARDYRIGFLRCYPKILEHLARAQVINTPNDLPPEVREISLEAVEIAEELIRAEPEGSLAQALAFSAFANHAKILDKTDKEGQALFTDRAYGILHAIDFESIQEIDQRLACVANANDFAFVVLDQLNRTEQADEVLQRVIEFLQAFVKQRVGPDSTINEKLQVFNLSEALERKIMLQRKIDPQYDALNDYLVTFELRQRALEYFDDSTMKHASGRTAFSIGRRYFERREFNSAKPWLQRADDYFRDILEADPINISAIAMVQMVQQLRGDVHFAQREWQAAIEAHETADSIGDFHGSGHTGANAGQILIAKAHLGMADEVLEVVEKLPSGPTLTGLHYCQALSICTNYVPDERMQDFRSRALDVLKEVIESNALPKLQLDQLVDALQNDEDFQPLRNDDRFKAILSDAQAQQLIQLPTNQHEL
jgi:tetratricopeptide (TPR) repeat protein